MIEINISENKQIQLPQGITISLPDSNLNFIDKVRVVFDICLYLFILLSIITLFIIVMIGNGYLTELLFTDSCPNKYQNWQVDFMRVTVILFWIQLLFILIYHFC
jgi:hypothetical protein